jgi:hypothetical protein
MTRAHLAFLLVAAASFIVLGCQKESASSADAATSAAPSASASASATAAASASEAPALAAHEAPGAQDPNAIPSQADESIAAAKEIDKSNYKTELTSIDKELK